MSNTQIILHIKGTEQDTTTLPKHVVRAAISQGQITHSQLIWSPEDNAWKQVRELPHLLPSQKLAPAPTPRLGTGALPKIEGTRLGSGTLPKIEGAPQPRIGTGALPKIEGAPQPRIGTGTLPKIEGTPQPRIGTGALPKVKAAAAQPQAAAASEVPAEPVAARPLVAPSTSALAAPRETNPLKWICIVLSVVILGALGFNYVMVDQPLMAQLSKTSYGNLPVYAHLGAFMQPNVIIIHVPPSPQVTEANMIDFLSALARSTPQSPTGGVTFDHVVLTPGWLGRYGFSGSDWQQLGEMQSTSEAERKTFILEKLTDPSGVPLLSTHSSLSQEAQEAGRDKVWTAFVAAFTGR